MLRITLPDRKPLAWYLAAERFLAERGIDAWLFWTPPPTVICGRHQDIASEVNLPFCRSHGIAVVRRSSGGGTVYADRGNLMISRIATSTNKNAVYSDFLQRVSAALRTLGYPAVTTEHNDILVSGYKVSGTACYVLPHATVVHGTLLCTVDMDILSQAITPSAAKLKKHAVSSVRQRVRNLGSMPDIASLLTSESQPLSPSDLSRIDLLSVSPSSPV